MNTLKVLVIDDSSLYRKIVQDALTDLAGVEVVGTAPNGKIAMEKVSSLNPDLLFLDIEMPVMNGLEVLAQVKKEKPNTGVVMVSAHTTQGAEVTLKALEMGAFDFISKPQGTNLNQNANQLKSELSSLLHAFVRVKQIRQILYPERQDRRKTTHPKLSEDVLAGIAPLQPPPGKRCGADAVAITTSTGGPVALSRVIPNIPRDIGVPLFIVQHMPAAFTRALAEKLDAESLIRVKEATDGELAAPNTAYIAPGGRQMKVEKTGSPEGFRLRITDDPPENNCRPSADYLFQSLASEYGPRATGVIMTGMGSDGTRGLKLMKDSGATIIAQDEASCIVYSMPRKPVEMGIVDLIVPLDRIAAEILYSVKRS